MAVFAHGHPGQWWAEVMGIRYPTVGAMRVKENHFSKSYRQNAGKSPKLLEELAKGRVVLCEETKKPDGVYQRIGYIGLYEISNLVVTPTSDGRRTIEFDLGKKIVGIKNK